MSDVRHVEGVAVVACFGDYFACDVATGAGAVINDGLLLPACGELLADHARENVRRPAGRKPTMMRIGRCG